MLGNKISIIGNYRQINRLGDIEFFGEVFEKLDFLASKDTRPVDKLIKYETIIGKAISKFLGPELKRFKIKPYIIPGQAHWDQRRILQKEKDFNRNRDILITKIATEKLQLEAVKTVEDSDKLIAMHELEIKKLETRLENMKRIYKKGF